MLIEIHSIQNHSPANLNRDDLEAPKTCYFGGVMRSRISSQCIKRSIRMSDEFARLLGGVRTRQVARLIAKEVGGDSGVMKRAEKILEDLGIKPKKNKDKGDGDEEANKSKMLVYTTREAIREMGTFLKDRDTKNDEKLAREFSELISKHVAVPDMALSGRMLEPSTAGKSAWKGLDTSVEAALQVAHAKSTQELRQEVDYYVAADDEPGDDAGAGYVDEAMFASACFYKYFSIHWETLVENLKGNKELAAHTVGAFIRGAATVNPTGKQNSFAAHNPPDGILVEIKKTPISYANAFASPVSRQGDRDILAQSIAQLAQYMHDLDTGYGKPDHRFWFSPNLRYPLRVVQDGKETDLTPNNIKSLDDLVPAAIAALGHDWEQVKKVVVNPEVAA